MGEYRLLIKASARTELDGVSPKALRQRIVERIRGLAENPRGQDSEKLAGHDDRFRARQGRYRIIYLIDDQKREVTIFKVGHRKDVYR